jgi:hypothetical protein
LKQINQTTNNNMKLFIISAALIAIAIADRPAPSYRPSPVYRPAAYQPAPSYKAAPANYQYGYDVVDGYAGVNFGHNEARDGYATSGQYHVLLPDGRVQTVTYTVGDAYSGYVADVQYSGYAKAPTYAPKASYAPKPAPYHA